MAADWALEYPGTRLVFGDESGIYLSLHPDIGPLQGTVDDASAPRSDGTLFGSDYVAGRTVGVTFGIDGKTAAEARDRYEILDEAWRAEAVRTVPGGVAQLVSDRGRRAFGRPRRFAPTRHELLSAYIEAVGDFATADGLWYGDEQAMTVQLVPVPEGGFVFPLVFPIATTGRTDRSTVFRVGGRKRTWPVFEVQGPITDPVIEVVGVLRIAFRLSLAYDETLVVDTRPWVRSTLLNGAGVVATRESTQLDEASVPPGAQELVLRGTSEFGTARATVRWRDAYPTP